MGFALNSILEGLMRVYRAEGMAGLWKGSGPSILKVGTREDVRVCCERHLLLICAQAAPQAAVTLTAYEIVLGLLIKMASPVLEIEKLHDSLDAKRKEA